MIYYIVFFMLIALLNGSGGSNIIGIKNVQKNIFIFTAFAIACLIGLRDITVGPDTQVYVWQFKNQNFNFLNFNYREPLYASLLYICQSITDNYKVFLLIFAMPISLGYSFLLKKYSSDLLCSILLFCALSIMGFAMAGLRQAVALGFTMFAFYYAMERKPIKFITLCIIAFLFHNSAIIFFFVYFIINLKPKNKIWLLVIIAVILGRFKHPIVMTTVNLFSTREYEMSQVGLNYTMFFIQFCLLFFCWIYKRNDDYNTLYIMSFIGLMLQAFTPIKGEFFRLSMYFSVYLSLLVPNIIHQFKDKRTMILLYFLITSILFIYVVFWPSSVSRSYSF